MNQKEKKSPDILLYNHSLRSHEIVIRSIDSLDSKAGSMVNVAAVLSGLILASGILAFREVWNPQREAFVWIYPLGGLLAIAIGASLAALLLGAVAWRKARIVIIDPNTLTERFENSTEQELRRFLIVQIGDEFERMIGLRDDTLWWLRKAFPSIGVSVIMLLVYAAVLIYVLVT